MPLVRSVVANEVMKVHKLITFDYKAFFYSCNGLERKFSSNGPEWSDGRKPSACRAVEQGQSRLFCQTCFIIVRCDPSILLQILSLSPGRYRHSLSRTCKLFYQLKSTTDPIFLLPSLLWRKVSFVVPDAMSSSSTGLCLSRAWRPSESSSGVPSLPSTRF